MNNFKTMPMSSSNASLFWEACEDDNDSRSNTTCIHSQNHYTTSKQDSLDS